ncbi:MAG: DUF4185 domain-containing protein [Armatimonadota bacterium]
MITLFLALLAATPVVVPGSVQKVSQLTGEHDRQLNRPTPSRTASRFGLAATDLGASFEHEGKLVFLFGDTHPSGPNTPDRPYDGDSVAFSTDTNPDDGLELDFVTAPDGKYLAVSVPGVSLKGFEVPNGGFSHNGFMYAFFTTDAQDSPRGKIMGRSVLLRSKDAKQWELVYTLSTDRFINVSPAVVDAAEVPGLPVKEGKGLLMWAAGKEYRRSDPYLAFVPLEKVEDRSAIRYWTGGERWSALEGEARPLFYHPMIGELSVAWCAPLKRWLMLYNLEHPRGVVIRTAERPAGPWSEARTLLDPWQDAYGKFIHDAQPGAAPSSLHDPGRERVTGGPYGPYLIPRFFKGDEKEATIYFVLSTWNPYNVMLMRATLRPPSPDLR